MSARFSSYIWPGLAGAVVAFLVRLIVGDLAIALIGVVVFAVIYCALIGTSHSMGWSDSPVAYAVISAVATTVAFLASHSL